MTIEQEKYLKENFEQKFKEIYNKGLAAGMYAACKVISDTANSTEVSETDRLNKIKRFCNVSLGNHNE